MKFKFGSITFLIVSISISFLLTPEIYGQEDNLGMVEFDKKKYESSDTVVITVSDYLANFDSGSVDNVEVHVVSSLFSQTMILSETGVDTDLFTGRIPIKSDLALFSSEGIEIPITVYYLNEKIFDSAVVCCVKTTDYLPNDNITAIDAIPYKLTLFNDIENNKIMENITYKVTFSSEHNFKLVDPIMGTFSNAYLENEKTVVFQTDQLKPGETMYGIVGIHSNPVLTINEQRIENEPKFDLTISVTANGQTPPSYIVDPWLEITEVATQIIENVRSGFELSVDIYTITVPCFNLTVNDEQGEDDSIGVSIPIMVENCSEHPQKVKLKSELAEGVEGSFDSNNFDISSHNTRTIKLEIVNMEIDDDGPYKFKITGDVIYEMFGVNWKATSSEGEGWFNITNGKVVVIPEFPLSIVVLIVAFIPLVVLFRKFNQPHNSV